MNQTIIAANQRGRANFGWLDSKHTFSFGSYYDPNFMGFSDLRVINDDTVTAGAGFGTHGHRDMEILSYILEGTIEHKDTMGNIKQITAGEFQIMSAGTGVAHSEYNASKKDRLKFLQIWLLPNARGVKPAYAQKNFAAKPGLTAVIHPSAEGAMRASTDAKVYRYQGGETSNFSAEGNQVYVHIVKGDITVNGDHLKPGDGIAIEGSSAIIESQQGSEALVFDLS